MEAIIENDKTIVNQAKKRNFNLLDLVKFLMAIIVIANHAEPLISLGEENVWYKLYNIIDDMAVPVFFIASSFLLFFKLKGDYYSKESTKVVGKYIIRIIKLYCIWSLIYLPISIYDYSVKQVAFSNAVVDYIKNFFFVGGSAFLIPQWYLLASIIGAFFMWLMLKMKAKGWVILLVALICLFLSKGLSYLVQNADSFSGALASVAKFLGNLFWTGGKIFNGIWYFAIGFIFAKYIDKIGTNKLTWKLLLPLVLVVYVGCFLLTSVKVKGLDLGILAGQIILHPLFVALILSISIKDRNIKGIPLYPLCRHTSTVMYFTHIYFIFLWRLAIGIGVDGFKGWQDFLFTTACTLVVSIIIGILMCKYPKNKVLKVLFR